MPTLDDLKILQALPLDLKICRSERLIKDCVNYFGINNVYIAFSGGKDSSVLVNIARKLYPNIRLVFVNTGLEFPEIQKFVKTFENVTILRPEMRFDDVIKKYGYPFLSKVIAHNVRILRNCPDGKIAKTAFSPDKAGKYGLYKYKPVAKVDFLVSEYCCIIMKENPVKQLNMVPIIATMAVESSTRRDKWLQNGCNAFELKNPHSAPMSFWTEQDVLLYAKTRSVKLPSVYGDIVVEKNGLTYDNTLCDCVGKLCTTGCQRTGCIFCGFGAHLDKGESRFERLKRTHPRQYEYCMGGGAYGADGLWKPTSDGLGMAHCIDVLNQIYGKNFIKY